LPSLHPEELAAAWLAILSRAKNRTHHRIGRQELSIREHMSRILKRLTPGEFIEFKDLFPESSTVHELVVTFLAVLELTKETLLDVTQAEPFAPIYVKLHELTTE
jgi:segregation and condensation protein A